MLYANVNAYLRRKELYMIGQNGDHLELRNDTMFAAKLLKTGAPTSKCQLIYKKQ